LGVVNLGVDFGGTGLRAAYAIPGEPVRFVELPSTHWPWLLYEPARSSRLAVAFPSLKSRLGVTASVPIDGRLTSPSSLVTRALEAVRRRVEGEGSMAVGKAVISVPARYTSAQRAALRDAALQAGLAEVQLINDSVAAVIAQASQSGTFLVYAMGYGGFELGLVRAASGRHRVLGYEGASAPGGSTLDLQVLAGWIETLRLHRLLPDMSRLDTANWLQLRGAAQRVKEELGAKEQVMFPLHPHRADRMVTRVLFERAGFEANLRETVATTIDQARALLEQSHLTTADVDTVLLVGGSTRMRSLQAIVETALGVKPALAQPEDVARGAALHADRLGGMPPSGHEDRVAEAADQVEGAVGETSVLTATVVTTPSPDSAGVEWLVPAAENRGSLQGDAAPGPPRELDEARRLADQGQGDQAVALLRQVIAEAQALLDQVVGTAAPSSSASPGALRSIALARALLGQHKYEEAVSASHAAFEQARESPDVFEAMIDVHCQAAMSEVTVEGFPDAERWLRCAYSHDQSNAQVREFLAQRTYLHARQLSRLGQRKEALRALDECLTWDPGHRAGQDLQQSLERKRSLPPKA
jgi:tetratricopeptide (TPR) repeat protein